MTIRSVAIIVVLALPTICPATSNAATPPTAAAAIPIPRHLILPPGLIPSPAAPVQSPPQSKPAPVGGKLGVVNLLDPHTGKAELELTFPLQAATADAIRRFTSGRVSAVPNRCAGSMREAMGWGLGDAHEWMRLTDVGFARRPAGASAQPGDIVVWPFTFGHSGSQHIGIAVGTASGVRLLSNFCGSIEVTALAPGYAAFHSDIGSPAPGPSMATASTGANQPGRGG